ncbi:MAG: glycosyltransferase [Bacteroidales bacterium]
MLITLAPYVWFLLRTYRALLRIRPFSCDTRLAPASVIVACRNEQHNLPGLLGDIAAQEFDGNMFELIIVDDNSTDLTFETAARFNAIKNLKVLRNRGTGKKDAIRTGVEASQYKLVITTDADCRIGALWLKTISSFFAENDPSMIICPVIQESGSSGIFEELEFLALQGVTAGAALSGDPVMCNGANMAFSREDYTMHSADLQSRIESGDDIFLLHSMKKDKLRILWLESDKAAAKTKGASSGLSFLRQRSRWLSKAGSYSDKSTISLALSVFAAVLLQAGLLTAVFFDPAVFLPVFLAVFIIKSVPDYLIIRHTAERYGKKDLLKWFLPSQLVYPFYVIAVILIPRGRWEPDRISSPSPTGT